MPPVHRFASLPRAKSMTLPGTAALRCQRLADQESRRVPRDVARRDGPLVPAEVGTGPEVGDAAGLREGEREGLRPFVPVQQADDVAMVLEVDVADAERV